MPARPLIRNKMFFHLHIKYNDSPFATENDRTGNEEFWQRLENIDFKFKIAHLKLKMLNTESYSLATGSIKMATTPVISLRKREKYFSEKVTRIQAIECKNAVTD